MPTTIFPFGEKIEAIKPITLSRVWFVALFLETLFQLYQLPPLSLYGCGLLQAWIYFQRCGRDHWRLKVMVAVVIILEGAQIVVFFELLYKLLIGQGTSSTYWEEIVHSFPTVCPSSTVIPFVTLLNYRLKYLSAFIVQT
ncbi:hypothetical protein BJ165DRAFT_1405659 [Panaeolus papilionaceus]|nr:hypothetical protein BJ165DRAFT_1405659 [Panaeolus papilionaceus]